MDLAGKTYVVTGASRGIGRVIATALGQRGADLVLVGRERATLDAVAKEATAGRAGANPTSIPGDFSSMKDVRRVAGEIERARPRIHCVIHNAAALPKQRVVTDEGLEQGFAVNCAAPWVLTRALEPTLKKSAPSRVVFFIGGNSVFDVDDPQLAEGWNGWDSYGRGKHACALAMHALSKEWAGTGVDVVGGFPGLVKTEGMKEAIAAQGFGGRIMLSLIWPLMRSEADGAEGPLYAATTPGLPNGSIWSKGGKPTTRLPSFWNDDAIAARLVAILQAL